MQTTGLAYSVLWCHVSPESTLISAAVWGAHSDTYHFVCSLTLAPMIWGLGTRHTHRREGDVSLGSQVSIFFFHMTHWKMCIFTRYSTDKVWWCLLANYWGAIRCCTAYCLCEFSSDCDNQSTSQLELLALRKNNGSINIKCSQLYF